MARPLNKKFFGKGPAGSGHIQASSYRFTGQAESQLTGSIVSQKGSRKFVVTNGTLTEKLVLVNKAQGTLLEGEFIVVLKLDDGSTHNATKFFNRTVQVDNAYRIPFTVSDINVTTDSKAQVDEDDEIV
jgi:hypothetical protein